jgi:type IV/VI secretion system ImpK/VasF family protein
MKNFKPFALTQPIINLLSEVLSEQAYTRACQEIKALFLQELKHFCQLVRQSGGNEDCALQMQFALVALIDESIVNSTWLHKEYWLQQTLQYELYGNDVAGEEFYDRLNTLMLIPQQHYAEVSVYYLCLCFGFRGQYTQDSTEVTTLIAKVKQYLQLKPPKIINEIPIAADTKGYQHYYWLLGNALFLLIFISVLQLQLSTHESQLIKNLEKLTQTIKQHADHEL